MNIKNDFNYYFFYSKAYKKNISIIYNEYRKNRKSRKKDEEKI